MEVIETGMSIMTRPRSGEAVDKKTFLVSHARLNLKMPSFSIRHATLSPGLSHTCVSFGIPMIACR